VVSVSQIVNKIKMNFGNITNIAFNSRIYVLTQLSQNGAKESLNLYEVFLFY